MTSRSHECSCTAIKVDLDPEEFVIKGKPRGRQWQSTGNFLSLVNAVRTFCLPLCFKLLFISGAGASLWGPPACWDYGQERDHPSELGNGAFISNVTDFVGTSPLLSPPGSKGSFQKKARSAVTTPAAQSAVPIAFISPSSWRTKRSVQADDSRNKWEHVTNFSAWKVLR